MEKRSIVRDKHLCYRCLRHGHGIKECLSKVTCEVESCKSTGHHTLLHKELHVEASDSAEAKGVFNTVRVAGAANRPQGGAALDILPVRVSGGDVEVVTYALLDPGSSMSFCESALIDELRLKGRGNAVETLLETLTTKRPELLKSETFSLDVQALDGNHQLKITNVVMIDQIPVTPDNRNVSDDLGQLEYLRGVTLPEIDGATVTLLIGNDNYLAHFPLETRVHDSTELAGPLAIKTPLGWILKGPGNSLGSSLSSCGNFLLNTNHMPLDSMDNVLVTEEGEVISPSRGISTLDVDNLMHWLKSNQEAQDFGLKYSAEDVVAYDCMNRNISFKDGHFELPLLWKDVSLKLPESLSVARKRLEGVKRRLLRDDGLKELYCQQVESVLEHGYAEEVPKDEWESNNRVWYIPHHPVINPNKLGNVRIVYDCAAKSHGISVNEKLIKGPDLVNRLVGVLLRFRKDQVAIVADIESMFYQVRCAPKDRDSLRFLWWPNGDLNAEPVPFRMNVHLFGAKSSPSCAAYALLETAKRFDKYYPCNVREVIKTGFYVDDCLMAVRNEVDGIQLVKNLEGLLARGGFNLTKWISSSQAVMESIKPERRAKVFAQVELGDVSEERVLGMRWNVLDDNFHFNVKIPERPPTRRGLLAVTNAVFDPLGLVCPVILEARLLFRTVCQQKIGWDEPVKTVEAVKWAKWKSSQSELNDLKIPRCFKREAAVKDMQITCICGRIYSSTRSSMLPALR